jgi:4-amino-4-deoxy-L-arabinose transferase-like glycosyltransferase
MRHLPLVIVLAAALLLRGLNAVFLPWQNDDLVISDMKGYDRAAVALLRQEPLAVHTAEAYLFHPLGSDTYHPPGYYYFLAAVYALFGHSYLAVRVVQAVLGTLTCLLVYLLAREIFGPPAGFLAGLTAAVYPPLIFYTGVLLTETLTACLLTAASCCLVASARHKRSGRDIAVILSGLLLGFTVITRSIFLVAVPFVLLWLMFLAQGWRGWRPGVRMVLMLLVPIVLVIAPITARNWQIHGRLVPISTNGGVNFFLAHGGTEQAKNEVRSLPAEWSEGEITGISSRTQPEEEAYFYQLGWTYLRGHVLPTLRSLPGKLRAMYWASDYWPARSGQLAILHAADSIIWRIGILPLSILSLPLLRGPQLRRTLLLALIILSTLVIPLVFWAQPRFRLPLVPSFIVLAAGAVVTLGRRIAEQSTTNTEMITP